MQRLRRTLRIVAALTRIDFAVMTEYRAMMVIWLLSGALPLVMLAVWRTLAGAGPVGTFSPADFDRYFLINFLIASSC